jgi:hypothetical protein
VGCEIAEQWIDIGRPLWERAGFPPPRRRIQKHCARGDLECLKAETQSNEKYLITPPSLSESSVAMFVLPVRAARAGVVALHLAPA